MTEYVVKIAFWLRAFDSVTIEADVRRGSDREGKSSRDRRNGLTAFPEHIDTDKRRKGVIAYIDRTARDGHEPVIEESRSTTTASTVAGQLIPTTSEPTRSPAPRRAFAF